MKILAIEKEIDGVDWSNSHELLRQEALQVYQLQKSGIIREIYFNQNHCAVIILECESATVAKNTLNELPLVKSGLINFEVMELTPYNGFDRIIETNFAMTKLTENKLLLIEQCLLKCWSIKTSSKWTADNPYRGQCGVTALVINDLFGGEILKTEVEGQWHFYNRIDSKRYDFTRKQFDFEIKYQDIESNRKEAFADTNEFQYSTLKELIKLKFGIKEQ